MPIDLKISIEILNFLEKTILKEYIEKIIVNFHPALNINQIKKTYSYVFSNKRFDEIIRESSLVISNFSSVGIESLAYGVPSIIINKYSKININPIPIEINQNIWKECNTVEDFDLYFNNFYLNYDKKGFESTGKFVRSNYFSNVSKESLKNLNIS